MLLKDFIIEGTRSLESLYPSVEARNIVILLCEHFAGTKSYTHVIEPQFELGGQVLSELRCGLARLQHGEPIQYVTGAAEFCGRVFRVCPDVLIPRPETEILAQEAVGLVSDMSRKGLAPRVLDLCTGSGCIAWTVALASPDTEVVAVDISDAALQVASTQPLSEDGSLSPVFVKADVLDGPEAFPYGPFDVILSNPPYIMDSEKAVMRANVLGFEPSLALFVPDADPLLFYRSIARWSRHLLADNGVGLTEINELLGPQSAQLFKDAGFTQVEIIKDFFGKDRFVRYMR